MEEGCVFLVVIHVNQSDWLKSKLFLEHKVNSLCIPQVVIRPDADLTVLFLTVNKGHCWTWCMYTRIHLATAHGYNPLLSKFLGLSVHICTSLKCKKINKIKCVCKFWFSSLLAKSMGRHKKEAGGRGKRGQGEMGVGLTLKLRCMHACSNRAIGLTTHVCAF